MWLLYKYYDNGMTRINKITKVVYCRDYKLEWFRASEETQRAFSRKYSRK